MKRLPIVLAVLAAVVAALFGYAFLEARRDPVVREASFALPGWPPDAAPLRVALLSDVHFGSAAMDAQRLGRIVAQVNARHPDLVLIAGDFIAGGTAGTAAQIGAPMVAPLAGLRAPLGVIAVLGNHDHWTGAAATHDLLVRAGIAILENQAVQRGPLVIGGVGDKTTRHYDVARTLMAMARLPGPRIMLSHSPDIAPALPADALLLAGHTHCGQILLPLWGPTVEVSAYGARFRCGIRREGLRTVVTTAGLGTSVVPLRFGAPPDWWLLTLGPLPR